LKTQSNGSPPRSSSRSWIANGTVNALAALWIVLGVLFGAAFVAAIAGIVFHDSEASA